MTAPPPRSWRCSPHVRCLAWSARWRCTAAIATWPRSSRRRRWSGSVGTGSASAAWTIPARGCTGATINVAHSHFRRRQAARRARRRVEAHASVPTLLPDTADAVAVREALARLPERHRRVLVLRYWADLSMAETAVALGVSLSAAKSRASRATAALAALLDGTEDAHVG